MLSSFLLLFCSRGKLITANYNKLNRAKEGNKEYCHIVKANVQETFHPMLSFPCGMRRRATLLELHTININSIINEMAPMRLSSVLIS